jgi:hypothetical protein
MDDDALGTRSRKWLWMLALAVIVAAGAIWLYSMQERPSTRDRYADPPSAEWTTRPEGGVEVDLPDTPMTNVPLEDSETPDAAREEPEEE